CTAFVGHALLDADEAEPNPCARDMAVSAAAYMTRELFWRDQDGAAGFSYPRPPAHTRVHNANLMAAAFLCRVHARTGDADTLDPAMAATRAAVAAQRADGSWPYGHSSTHAWIDNFHTGYNLCALDAIGHYAQTLEFDASVSRGLDFYREHFFNED